MVKEGGLGDNLYCGGFDLSGDASAVQTVACRRNNLEVPGLDKSAMERIPGLRDGEISFNSWFNQATGKEHEALSGLPRTDRVTMYFRGTTLGNAAACLEAKQVNYNWERGGDGSLAGSIQALGNGNPVEWGQSLTAGKRTDSAATDGTGIDLTTVTTAFGAAAYLNVFAFTGTSVTVKVQDSADDISYADISPSALDFTAVTSAPAQERIETGLTQTIRRYLRAITIGTFSDAVFAVGVDRYRAARAA